MTRRTPPSGSAPPAPLRRLTPQPAAVPARRWRAWQWVVVAAHLAVILGLLATTGGVVLAGRMALRGIETGEDGQPIPYTDVNPLGVNTFLNELANPADVARELDMIAAAGFSSIRQPFFWYEIEPQPGVYQDPQWGGSTWTKYDRIVELAQARGIEIIARLDKPPRWARAGQPNLDQCPDGPPTHLADYAHFVATVVSRYRGRIHYIQLWNEPNLQGEWGCQPIDPAAFTQLLKAGYEAAKQADPSIVVLMPGLAPTDQRGPANLSDLLFLQGMYDAGAKPYFDIATAMVYGYGYSPEDRRVSFARNNFSRVIQTREIMVRNGDAAKPLWVMEYAWEALPPGWTGRPSVWGKSVSPDTQARYLYEGYLRAQREWPWMGVMCIWYFRWPIPSTDPQNRDDPTRGFAIVNEDFTPRPAYTLLSQSRSVLDRAWTGVYPAASRYLTHDAHWSAGPDTWHGAPVLRPTQPGASATITFGGPGLDLILTAPAARYAVWIDGHPAPGLPRDTQGRAVLTTPVRAAPNAAVRVTVARGLADAPHTARIEALDTPSAGGLAGFAVVRIPPQARQVQLSLALCALALLLNLGSLLWNLRHPLTTPLPTPRTGMTSSRPTPTPEPRA